MPRLGQLGAAICTVILVAAAGAIVAWEKWQGPVVLALSGGHGIHVGDLLAIPLVALAIALWRRRILADGHAAPSPSLAFPVSAIVLGLLLLLAGVVAKAGGGSLVPSGGGTLDGAIEQTSGTDPVPVDRWSDVAVTYDGAALRLYVNGRQVSSRAASGTIQTTRSPLWIGGNRPYGEHFHGVIDEVRVYARALGADEIREDMAKPVGPARGLVAAYSFDAGSGARAPDSSGEGNTAAIRGATWTRGRYGDALSFDGEGAVVAVPASTSLGLRRAMTLSGWVRPAAPQSGWRTIVQRQTDAYILTAGSDSQVRLGWLDDVRAALIVAALVWFCLMIATGLGPLTADRRQSWWQPVALFLAGSLADAALAPQPSLIGPILVAYWLAATAPSRAEAIGFLVAAVAFAGLTIASLAGVAGVDAPLSADDGAVARSIALGALFAMAGAALLISSSTHRSSSAAEPGPGVR